MEILARSRLTATRAPARALAKRPKGAEGRSMKVEKVLIRSFRIAPGNCRVQVQLLNAGEPVQNAIVRAESPAGGFVDFDPTDVEGTTVKDFTFTAGSRFRLTVNILGSDASGWTYLY